MGDKTVDLLTSTSSKTTSSADLLVQKYNIKDIGDPDTLCNTILQWIAEEKYDIAIKELKQYQKVKNEFPRFEGRTTRYFSHCIDLMGAIRSKKNFPNVSSLPVSKQQELDDIVREHFNDLKKSLKRIAQIESDLRLDDARSTVWVLNTFMICALVLLIFALVREALLTLGTPVEVAIGDVVNLFFELLGM